MVVCGLSLIYLQWRAETATLLDCFMWQMDCIKRRGMVLLLMRKALSGELAYVDIAI